MKKLNPAQNGKTDSITQTPPRGAPQRTCAACRAKKGKQEFHRVVIIKGGGAVLDESGKGQGRGAYVCKNAACIEKLIKQRGLNRSFKREIEKGVYEALALKAAEKE